MENILNTVKNAVISTENGFKPMKETALLLFKTYNKNEVNSIANSLYVAEEYQMRMVAVFLFGFIASSNKDALLFLKSTVSLDENWRVQEILAMSFDQYCKDISYEKAIPTIELWLNSEKANVRRAVSEGLRIWTSRPYFKENPKIAIQYLSNLRNDSSEYVRKSAGNALRDISKQHAVLVKEEVLSWKLISKEETQVFNLVIKNGLLK